MRNILGSGTGIRLVEDGKALIFQAIILMKTHNIRLPVASAMELANDLPVRKESLIGVEVVMLVTGVEWRLSGQPNGNLTLRM